MSCHCKSSESCALLSSPKGRHDHEDHIHPGFGRSGVLLCKRHMDARRSGGRRKGLPGGRERSESRKGVAVRTWPSCSEGGRHEVNCVPACCGPEGNAGRPESTTP